MQKYVVNNQYFTFHHHTDTFSIMTASLPTPVSVRVEAEDGESLWELLIPCCDFSASSKDVRITSNKSYVRDWSVIPQNINNTLSLVVGSCLIFISIFLQTSCFLNLSAVNIYNGITGSLCGLNSAGS